MSHRHDTMREMRLPTVATGEPLSISASTYTTYRQCPAMAEARLRGVYGPESMPAFRGGLAHAVFARHLESGPIDSEEFTQVCYESIGGSSLNFKLAPLGLKPSSLRSVIAEVRDLYERFKSVSTDGYEGSEVALHHEADGDVTLLGRIDAVFEADGQVRLVDWKTGELGDVLDQLRFYALLWVLTEGRLPAAVEAFSVGTGEQYRDAPSVEDVEATAREVAAMVTTLRAAWHSGKPVERRGGPWCRYCPILDDCSEGRAAVRTAGAV